MSSHPAQGKIRLATSSPSTQATTKATLAQLRRIAQLASREHHADILVLPEAYLGGYPRGTAFGCVIGSRSAEGRDEFLRYFEQAVDLGDVVGGGAGGGEDWVRRRLGGGDRGSAAAGDGDGEAVRRGDGTREELEDIAAETGVFLVVGCIEKAGGSLYCAAVYVCPKKGMVGKRRKVMPTATERLVWAQGSPKTLQAISTTIRGTRVNMAAAICWESYMPLLRQALYAQNINLYLAPTADGRDAWLSLMRTAGIEGRCFVISSNMCVREKGVAGEEEGIEVALPPHGASGGNTKEQKQPQQRAGATFISRGGSCITDPFGEVLAGPQWEDDTGIVTADVDFKDCIRGRLDLDAAGSYSRNDSFRFSVEGLNLMPLPY